ncbi:helix-turn-helix domain-containing protein [Leptolyngbya sp. AN03gr2]|uniref:helix-turn-helix domain-containing protein n=1 Tax=unclassified Leptolyngbya TaxID=2650499 RepID=UPI003D31214C
MKTSGEEDSLEWSSVASERLKTLMLFLLEGVWGLPEELQSPDFPLYKPLTQRELAAALGSYQGTIGEWKRGRRPSLDGQRKLAAYCHQSLKYLQDYLEGRVSLVDFCKRVDSSLQSTASAFDQIVELLPNLQVQERAEIMHRCIDSWVQESEISSSFRNPGAPPSLSWLILQELVKPQRQWSIEALPLVVFLELAGLSFSQLEAIFLGTTEPLSESVLEGLSKVLTKDLPARAPWSVEDLLEIALGSDTESRNNPDRSPLLPTASLTSKTVWHELASDVPVTIGALIAVELKNRSGNALEHLSSDTEIGPDRLLALQSGVYPDSAELCLLALGLRKQPDIYWTQEELRQIREAEFGIESDESNEIHRTNGEPNGTRSSH